MVSVRWQRRSVRPDSVASRGRRGHDAGARDATFGGPMAIGVIGADLVERVPLRLSRASGA